MIQTCGNCRHFQPDAYLAGHGVGDCTWLGDHPIWMTYYSFSMRETEGQDCKAWAHKSEVPLIGE